MTDEKSSKKGLIIVVIVVIVVAAGIGVYFLTKSEKETNANNANAVANTANTNATTTTNSTTTTNTNTAATANTNTAAAETEVMGDSKEVVTDLLAAAANEWTDDAVIHSLQSVASLMIVDNQKNYGGYEQGAYREWMGNMYSPSKGESALVAWNDGVAAIGDPYPGDDFSISISNSLTSLNSLATGTSSTEIYAQAVAQGLSVDNTTSYAEMEIVSAVDPSLWTVKQLSATEEDVYGASKELKAYSISSGI